MTITPAYLEELRARLSLSDVVGRKVTWDPGKSNPGRRDYWACCPFHQEDTPSFHADDRRGRYKCFGCGASGDVVNFVMETERLSFPEAVERLALEAGMEPPKRGPQDKAKTELRDRLIAAQDVASRFFRLELRRGAGRGAHAYLREARGLSEDTIERFALGYAPKDGAALGRFLSDNDVTTEDAVTAGLLIAPDDGGRPFARFRDRVMFPIRDGRGRTLAFGGRAMSSDAPAKYLNSPETPVFSKGRLLYHFDDARTALGPKGGAIVVVEGYMDVIGLVQAGVGAVVAPLGTAITEDQLRTAWRASDLVILALDGDQAGARAAARTLERALPLVTPDKELRFAFLPDGQDPDDLARRGGARAVRDLLDQALSVSDMIWRVHAETCDLNTPEGRAKMRTSLRRSLDQISNADLRAAYDGAFRMKLGALERPIASSAAHRAGGVSRASSRMLGVAASKAKAASNRSIALLVGAARAPEVLDDHLEAFAAVEFGSAELDLMREHLLSAASSEKSVSPESALRRHWGDRWNDLAAEAERAVPWLKAGAGHAVVIGGWVEALSSTQSTLERRRRRRGGV